MIGDDFEKYGDLTPLEAAEMVRMWADDHAIRGHRDHAKALWTFSSRILRQDSPIQCVVLRSPDLYAFPVAEFFINPSKEVTP